MNTAFWGRNMWHALHSITFAYPNNPTEEDKENYKRFFEDLKYTLPCETCRNSYTAFLKCIPINGYLMNRSALTFWLYLIHDLVNKKIGKKSISYEEVVNMYVKGNAKSCKSS